MSDELRAGEIFAEEFQIERFRHHIGGGQLYVARQLRTNRRCALKVLDGRITAARRRDALFTAAHLGQKVPSEHAVKAFAMGVDSVTDLVWFAMELLEGETLFDRLRTGPLPIAEAETVLLQLCEALASAHRAGVVHYALTPLKVFLALSGGARAVKVLGFGTGQVARDCAEPYFAPPHKLWIAPELIRNDVPLSGRVDLWALGLIAFQALVGAHYWLAARDGDSSPMMLFREILMSPLVSASERAAALGLPDRVPRGFDAWFERTVSRERSERYGDVTEAQTALARILGEGRERERWASNAEARDLEKTFEVAPPSAAVADAILVEEEARRRLDAVRDPRTKALLGVALDKVRTPLARGVQPRAPFDAAYFIAVVEEALNDPEALVALLRADREA